MSARKLKQISITVTVDEAAQLAWKARKRGQSLSGYLREQLGLPAKRWTPPSYWEGTRLARKKKSVPGTPERT